MGIVVSSDFQVWLESKSQDIVLYGASFFAHSLFNMSCESYMLRNTSVVNYPFRMRFRVWDDFKLKEKFNIL